VKDSGTLLFVDRFRIGRIVSWLAVVFFGLGLSLKAATLLPGFAETQYGANVGASPTAMEFSPDGRLFVCLQTGQLRVIDNTGTLLATPFVTVTTTPSGERGLLGIAFDPNFATNQFVYVYYTVPTAPIHNRISRFTANGNVAVAGSETIILELDNLSTATNHNGGAIHFGPDGKLYVAVGENATPSNAQSLSNRLGKILRINPDGSIPSDNPTTFPGISGSTSGANRAIWSVGLRNPFTFGFQPGTGRLFINDVGQSTWEEINDGIIGSNYGWPTCEGFCSPPNANFREPLLEYGHTGDPNTTGCAIVGGAFYNPSAVQFPASYVGKYFFGDLCNGWIRVMDPSNNTASAFATGISTLVDLKVDSAGRLYYLAQGKRRPGFQGPVDASDSNPEPHSHFDPQSSDADTSSDHDTDTCSHGDAYSNRDARSNRDANSGSNTQPIHATASGDRRSGFDQRFYCHREQLQDAAPARNGTIAGECRRACQSGPA
jgi:glucose/arabinose dehydrogenase